MDRAEKRAYLRSYAQQLELLQRIQTVYNSVSEKIQTVPTARPDACRVSSSGYSDRTGEGAARLADLATELQAAKDKAARLYRGIYAAINEHSGGKWVLTIEQADACYYVFLECMSIPDTAQKMGKCERTIKSYLSDGIDYINLDKYIE